MRIMYDAVTASNIPNTAALVAGYNSGAYQSYYDMLRLFPNAKVLSIATNAQTEADILDCERFDASPEECPAWAVWMRSLGRIPYVYCNSSMWPLVIDSFMLNKVKEPYWDIAQYDGIAQLLPAAMMKQYLNMPGYDVSVVADYLPGIDQPPITRKTKGKLMTLIRYKGATYLVLGTGMLKFVHHTQDVKAYNAAGIPGPGPDDISDDEFKSYKLL